MPRRFVSAITSGSLSGLTMNVAPAACAARTSSTVSTVPAPIAIRSPYAATSAAIFSAFSATQSARRWSNVDSNTVTPASSIAATAFRSTSFGTPRASTIRRVFFSSSITSICLTFHLRSPRTVAGTERNTRMPPKLSLPIVLPAAISSSVRTTHRISASPLRSTPHEMAMRPSGPCAASG